MSAKRKPASALHLDTHTRPQPDVGMSAPRPVAGSAPPSPHLRATPAASLLKLESDVRELRTPSELYFFVANETRKFTRAQQIFVLAKGRLTGFQAVTVSAITTVERSSPLIVWVEETIARLAHSENVGEAKEFAVEAFSEATDPTAASYPLRQLLWTPLKDRGGQVIGGMLQARLVPWTDNEITISRHLAGAYAHALTAMEPRTAARWLPKLSRRTLMVALFAVAGFAAFPVSMTALAPVEVAPRDAFVVAAPIEGVIEHILVEPSDRVSKGQMLARLADTTARNRLAIAEREVIVAEAKLKKSTQLAFVDSRGRHELAVGQAELELRVTERDYARELLERTEIRAERDGVAFFTDKKELVGRPLAVGERIMKIADPSQSEFRIDLPAADAIVIEPGVRIKVFLDSAPMSPIEAKLVRADYQARPRDNQQVAFRIIGERIASREPGPRLGTRGTAQVYGSQVPFAFYLFRRPISALRQWTGI